MQEARSYQPLFWLIGIHALYFCVALSVKGFYLIDSYGYAMQADNMLANGSWYAEDWNAPLLVDYFSIRPPLYATLIVFFRLFSDSIIPLLVLQNIISIVTCWMIYSFVVRNGFGSKTTKRMLIIAVILYPAQMIHANFVMTEIVFQFWLVSVFLTLYAFAQQPTWKSSLILSVLLSVCLLTKPVSLFLPVIVCGFMLWFVFKKQSRWQLMIPQLLVVFMFHGICLQNQHATGYYHYSSIKNINQLKYNARYTLIAARGEEYADSTVAAVMQQANAATNYGERLNIMNDKANAIIFQYPVAFAKVYAKGVVAYFVDPGRFDVFHFFNIEEKGTLGLMHEMQTQGVSAIQTYIEKAPVSVLFLLLMSLLWNCCVVFLFLYFLFTTQNHTLRNILFVLVAYIGLATGPVGVSRYRVPVFPFLLIGVLCASYTYIQRKELANA
ncbi:MAG: glycosyltransferase family 39 protein [Bacteroidota bacterium]